MQRLANWESRERRKEKECEKDAKREKEKREDMVRDVVFKNHRISWAVVSC